MTGRIPARRKDGLRTFGEAGHYHHFAETGIAPSPDEVASRVDLTPDRVLEAYQVLRAKRVLALQQDGASILMAPPFSGLPTQHIVEAGRIRYFANCAWDSLGIPVALRTPATVQSRCGLSLEPLRLEVGLDGPGPSDWVFHCLVPTAHWWDDIGYT